MSSRHGSRLRGSLSLSISLGTHGLLAALVVLVGMHVKPQLVPAPDEYQIAMVQVAGGSAVAKSPLLIAPNGDKNAEKVGPESRLTPTAGPKKRRIPKASGSEAQTARAQDRGTGSAAGNGSDAQDATFAFPTFSPKPPVADRSLLPSSDRRIIVDVKLNAAGEVIGENLVTGMENALDQIILNTVKSWRFQPATLNGHAVPSDAEVIFTFGPRYPITGS